MHGDRILYLSEKWENTSSTIAKRNEISVRAKMNGKLAGLTGKDKWRYGEERADCRAETEAVDGVMLWVTRWDLSLRFDDGS